ncbi:MAG: hypothetical protein CL912_31430 [Deltaproteobacteria bacterium]|nr:hypothetical protein [Deltaproteobacteria bacterium]
MKIGKSLRYATKLLNSSRSVRWDNQRIQRGDQPFGTGITGIFMARRELIFSIVQRLVLFVF